MQNYYFNNLYIVYWNYSFPSQKNCIYKIFGILNNTTELKKKRKDQNLKSVIISKQND